MNHSPVNASPEIGSEPIIRIEGLTKRFGNMTAVDEVDLEIHPGELFGLLGPNGAGKTTIISILATIISAGSGSASVCGFDVSRHQDAVRKNIGIVFQDPSLDDELTGEENLDFHGRLYGMAGEHRRKRIEEVLELVDLTDRRSGIVKTYSGGMRRRLEIARGLMHRPRVLFLDEPTLGLDPQTRRKIWSYIRQLMDAHRTTIILTTHYMEEADQLCSRIGIIDRGKIVALDTPTALKAGLGGDFLEMDVTDADAGFLERLGSFPGVSDVNLTNGRLVMTVEQGEVFIPEVVREALARDIHISSISMRKPDLEDVFIALTGRDIRDSEVTNPWERMRIYLAGRKR